MEETYPQWEVTYKVDDRIHTVVLYHDEPIDLITRSYGEEDRIGYEFHTSDGARVGLIRLTRTNFRWSLWFPVDNFVGARRVPSDYQEHWEIH